MGSEGWGEEEGRVEEYRENVEEVVVERGGWEWT